MEQPHPIRQQGAHIADHRSLVDLGNALQYTGDSVERLRSAVDGYFLSVTEAMEQRIGQVRAELEQARSWLAAAQSALSACRDRRRYDSEKEEWVVPDCSCEERDVTHAEKEVARIAKVVEHLEHIRSEVEHELYEYRQPMGIVTPGGGDGVLHWLGDTLTVEAMEQMDRILEVVERYLRVDMHNPGSTLMLNDATSATGACDAEADKAEEFRIGIERLQQRQRYEAVGDHKLIKPDAVAICPGCHRPIIACICGYGQRQNSRIFNYDLSR